MPALKRKSRAWSVRNTPRHHHDWTYTRRCCRPCKCTYASRRWSSVRCYRHRLRAWTVHSTPRHHPDWTYTRRWSRRHKYMCASRHCCCCSSARSKRWSSARRTGIHPCQHYPRHRLRPLNGHNTPHRRPCLTCIRRWSRPCKCMYANHRLKN